tara:strand:- start:18202 stop:19530 length:1329 start_codon:yes stop_codon:yes gene_type:complete
MSFPQIKYVAYKGGGAKGFIDIGVGLEFERLGLTPKISAVAGTSVGAIFSLFFASGLPAKKIEQIAFSTDFEKIIQNHWAIVNDWDLLTQGGLHDGAELHQFIKDFIKQITGNENTTFAQWEALKATNPNLKSFTVEACNISRGFNEVFSAKNPRLKDQPIWKAVSASSAFPVYFEPIELELTDTTGTRQKEKFSDGGLQKNCPLNLFNLPNGETNPEAIGIWLASTAEINVIENDELPPITDTSSAIKIWAAQVNALLEADTFNLYANRFEKQMVLCNNLNIGTLDFNLTAEQKQMLKLSGIISVFQYMAQLYPAFAALHYSLEQFDELGITQDNLERFKLGEKGAFPANTYESLIALLKTLPKPQSDLETSDLETLAKAMHTVTLESDPDALQKAVLAQKPKPVTLARDNLAQSPTASDTISTHPPVAEAKKAGWFSNWW